MITAMTRLNFGCGTDYRDGWVNVDKVPWLKADCHFDFGFPPYPFPDNTFDYIWSNQVFEHLHDIPVVMDELWRVTKPGGQLEITVPYGKSGYYVVDPTHTHALTEGSFSYFCGKRHFYSRHKWKQVLSELTVRPTDDSHTRFQALMYRLRNLLPFRKVLRFILWNMYDDVHVILQKPGLDL